MVSDDVTVFFKTVIKEMVELSFKNSKNPF